MVPNPNPQATAPAETGPLSPERLAQIRARVDAATPGPWCTDEWEIYQGAEYVAGAKWVGDTCRTYGDGGRADAQFTAHARTDVPDLLTEVARLTEVERRITDLLAEWETVAISDPDAPAVARVMITSLRGAVRGDRS